MAQLVNGFHRYNSLLYNIIIMSFDMNHTYKDTGDFVGTICCKQYRGNNNQPFV
ncbi:hypothetical protein CLU79DRAFT_268598 [Phycomyces nitens]|nr:hypothetical protein CLU79DRAFT_268598 [Phycomyces nitens]